MNENLNFDLLKQDVEKEVREKGFENLYYALFDEDSNLPWAIHLYYKNNKFLVNSRDDRSYIIGKSWEFENYEEAKHFFIKKMETFVQLNRLEIQTGHPPYYPSPLWDEKEDYPKMRDESKERSELLLAIQELGYESLRYSIFNDHSPREWETRIEYNPELEVYEVYSTMDRASTNGKDSYQNFQEARSRFIEILENVVFINRYYVDEGIGAEYSSPLWDKSMNDIENMKCIVEQEIKKRHFESLQYVLFDENKNFPWAFHLFYRDGKLMINGRDDRSYVMGNTIEFTRFEDAKIAFLERLEHFVKSNQLKVRIGKKPYYSSPLWDNEKAD